MSLEVEALTEGQALAAQSTSKGSSLPTRDETYYIEDGNAIILVGGTLFKVRL